MKLSYKITAFALGLSILVPVMVNAEEGANIKAEVRLKASTTVGTKDLKERIEKERENMKAKIASTTEARKDKMEAKKTEMEAKLRSRFSDFLNRVIERLNAASSRLDKIVLRIESRLTKLEADGGDESKARTLLADAKLKLADAKVSIGNISLSASSTITSTTTLKLNYPAVKDLVEKAKDDLKEAHSALIDVVKNIKPGRNKDHATSTTATTTNS